MTFLQAAILGALQGITELFPISSLGHSVIFPRIVGWQMNQKDPFFLTFLVATHLATAIVLFGFYWQEWVSLIAGIFRSLKEKEIKESDTQAKLAWLLIIGTIPAGILGLLLEDSFKMFFASPQFAAFFLICNGIMLYGAELVRKRKKNQYITYSEKRIAKLNWIQAFGIGVAQAIALIPGFSRTGAAIAGGLVIGFSHEDALHYAFLLATPIIGAAALLKIPELFTSNEQQYAGQALTGAFFAGFSAYFTVKFLEKYFQKNTLLSFAIYCAVAGGLVSVLFIFR